MLQRIQTIYLLLAGVCLGVSFLFPFASYILVDEEIIFNAYGLTSNSLEVSTFFPYYLLISLSLGVVLFSIIQYKKRKVQLKIGRLNYLLIIISLVFIFYEASNISNQFSLTGKEISYGIGLYLVVASLPFVFLANRSIKKDEDLIKSLDRLR